MKQIKKIKVFFVALLIIKPKLDILILHSEQIFLVIGLGGNNLKLF